MCGRDFPTGAQILFPEPSRKGEILYVLFFRNSSPLPGFSRGKLLGGPGWSPGQGLIGPWGLHRIGGNLGIGGGLKRGLKFLASLIRVRNEG